MSNITFVLFTYNEEKRISYAVRNFIKYGSVILMDGGSTDKTREIAEELGAKFFIRPDISKPQVETAENFKFIKNRINTGWIYWGYVDNIAPKSLLDRLVEISHQDKFKMVLIPLYTYLWGNIKRFSQKSYSPFLFHKNFVDFSNNYIHGMGKFTGKKGQLLKLPNRPEYALRHFSVYNIDKFIIGHLRYANQEAEEKYQSGKQFSIVRMVASILRYCWIYGKLNWRNGKIGLIIILSYISFRLMAYAKLYELENGIDLDSIEKKYSVLKEELIKEFD